MTTVTLQRDKCIGCGYCAMNAPQRFVMSKRDGKAVLIKSRNKKGFHVVKVNEGELDNVTEAAKACPVKIIKVSGVVE